MSRPKWRMRGATALAFVACACAPAMQDYTSFRQHMPKSILVLPPLNETTNVGAPYVFLSTVSRPVGEAGYYAFPVAVVDALMKENGLPTPGEMHQVPLAKLGEVFGADAVLYVAIEQWGQKYQVIDSVTVVKARAKLVDVNTGLTLWNGMIHAEESSSAGQTDLIGMLVAALIDQVIDSATDRAHAVSRVATQQAVSDPNTGFLRGPRHPDYEGDERGR
jgi:hypothetical protein